MADDRVGLWASGGELYGRSPASLAGLIELRGQGMAARPPLGFASVMLAVDLDEPPERQPDPAWTTLEGVRLPRHTLRPFDASAPARLSALLASL